MPITYNEEEYYTQEEAIHFLNVTPDYFEKIKAMKIDGMPPKWVLQPHLLPKRLVPSEQNDNNDEDDTLYSETVFYEKSQLKAIRSI